MRLASFCSAQSPEGQCFGSFQKAKDHAKQLGHVFDDDVAARKLALELAHDKGLPVDWEAKKWKSGAISCKVSERSEQAL